MNINTMKRSVSFIYFKQFFVCVEALDYNEGNRQYIIDFLIHGMSMESRF